ncbi:MAG: domain S-box protein [Fibrobacteres bacterium]|nr:domain S-box protein [Fibrobacterota bacterium]
MSDPGPGPKPFPAHSDNDQGDLYRLILTASLDAVVTIDDHGRVMDWNGRAEALFGWTRKETVGRVMAEFLVPDRYREHHRRGFEHFLRTGEGPILGRRLEMGAMHRDGQEIPIELAVTPVRRGGTWIFIAYLRDLAEPKRAQQRLEVQNAILRILTESPSLEAAGADILETICNLEPWRFGAFWRRAGDILICSHACAVPGARIGDFRERTLRSRFRKGEGFPGWIWELKHSQWIMHVQGRGFARSPEAEQDDLRSAYAFPVLLGGEVHGVFEFFGRHTPDPDTAMMEAISSIANQIGFFLARRISEEALKESEERFRVLANNAPVLIWITDVRGRCVYVNRPWVEFTGLPMEKALSGGWEASIHPEDYAALQGIFLTDMDAQRPFRVEFRMRDAMGGYRWFLGHGIPRYTAEGEFIGYIGACVDIDESKRVREEMMRSERRFRALIENSTDAIAIYTGDGLISYASASTEKVLGYTDKEFMGMHRFSLIHPEDLPLVKRNLRSILAKSGNRLEVEFRIRHKDGSWRWVEGSVVNLTGDPLVGGILANYRDVTEKKKATQEKEFAEDRLRQGQKMEAVGRLAGGIAHDFNNLLTSINGYSSMALDALHPEGQIKEFLQEILKSGERAAGLTKQLLAYSRKQNLAPKLWDLNEILLGMEGMLRRIIGEDIDMAVKPCNEACWGKVDRGQVEQIILNLVLNARDAMPQGGKLTLETANIDLDDSYVATHLDSTPGSYVMLAVSDTGTGMTEDVKRKLFEPFFTTKEAGRGTGLGLSSVYGIVKQSGGSINVYSEAGMGSTFRVYFPRAVQNDAAPVDSPRAANPENLRGRESLLLVEDEESVRRFAVQVLESQGYRVFTACNGREALDVLEKSDTPIQLIVTDVVMPDVGGQALSERVKTLRPALPILFISGYTENSVVHRGLINAGEPFLQKPFSPTELARKVREAMDRKPELPLSGQGVR